MSKLMEQYNVLHHRVQIFLNEHEAISHYDLICAPLGFERTVHDFYSEFIGYSVGITSPTQPDNVICFLNDLRCRGVQ